MPKYLAPWEDSPGKGSRDSVMLDAQEWGQNNLSKYLLDNNGDPLGVLDPQAVQRFLGPITARRQELAAREAAGGYLNYGVEQEPSEVFTEFTTPQVKAYVDKQRNDYIAAGNPGNDAMWMPQFVEVGGKPFIAYGEKNTGKGGILDQFTGKFENFMALSGFAGASLAAGAIAAEGAAAGSSMLADMATGGLGGLEGAAMFPGSTVALSPATPWTLSGAIDAALDPTKLGTSALKNAAGQLITTGSISPVGLISGVVGNAVGGVAGGAIGDATGNGLIGGVAGSLIGGAVGSTLNDALTDDPSPPSGSGGGGTPTGTGGTGTGATQPANDVPTGFDIVLSPYQPIYERV